MKMSRQHYEMIAKTIRDNFTFDERHKMAYIFAKALGDTNPLFDRDRFIRAAEGDDGATEGSKS